MPVFLSLKWKKINLKFLRILFLLAFIVIFLFAFTNGAFAEIAATHVYHNHMPNFWPYYDVSQYASTAVGQPIRHMYDGNVIDLKNNPPSGYPYYLPNNTPMPHDDLVSYYTHHAKTGAYLTWPWSVAQSVDANHPLAQLHVTMSGSVVNNVNSFMYTNNVTGYNNVNWGTPWRDNFNNLKTTNNKNTLDMTHVTGHHSMGPLVGNDYFLKDLIYQNATLAQPYFLGNSFKSSKGYFPTELGFSERLIPVLDKLGMDWSVLGNVHLSRTLRDYPLLDDPGRDCLISPPNRADMQNVSNSGAWVSQQMFNEQQVTHNKFPFASTPHWVKYVNPDTGAETKIVGVPVAQAESWEESYQGQVKATALKPFENIVSQKQYFVIAHDGDNSSGRAGSEETWRNAGNVTYTDPGVVGMGVDEYLINNTPAANDVVHVQDGSWVDTRDSCSDPQWHHWRLPFGIWKAQFYDFNRIMGTDYHPKTNPDGIEEGMTVSFEYGYHYLERNFALLQAALNYAKTAEQIWLDGHPNYWSPSTAVDNEITYGGNQLNPWMISFPVKGDAANDYAGGANPAELGWYFLLPAMDSGFGYYDENQDDCVKPTLSFNQSLNFSQPYVNQNIINDGTGPSVWWPQRWPYNPGSANCDKSEGWTKHYFDNNFAIYTYAYDVSDISSIHVKIRTHTNQWADVSDNTFRVYDPDTLYAQSVPNIDPSKVGDWVEYDMTERDLNADINGVDWQAGSQEIFEIVPAQEIGSLYYSYIGDYRNQLIDYYIEAVDSRGNITKTDIQSVYVGAGKYRLDGGKYIEDINGDIIGTYPFVTDAPPVVDTEAPSVPTGLAVDSVSASTASLSWTASTDNVRVAGYEIYRTGVKVGITTTTAYTDRGLVPGTSYTYTVKAYDGQNNISAACGGITATTDTGGNCAVIYYKRGFATPYIHYRPTGGSWTTAPGEEMEDSTIPGYSIATLFLDTAAGVEACFNDGQGHWDSNNGQNYQFGLGTSTYNNGQITTGAPVADTTAPSQPANLASPSHTASTASLTWSASTDNVGVTGYEIYRGAEKVGDSNTTNYIVTGLTQNTAYSFTVKAYDAAGNLSAASSPVNVTTNTANFAGIYYKVGFITTPYIHYRPVGGSWTTAPGALMLDSDIEGYKILTIEIGSATQLEACFNNGNGIWDNNGGQNYFFPAGTSTFDNGSITPGAPVMDTTAPSAPTNLAVSAHTAFTVSLTWTASTDNVAVTGYDVYRGAVRVGSTTDTRCMDTNLSQNTSYTYTVKAYDAKGNVSAASSPVSVTTDNGNSATIYYKRGFSTPYIHYRPVGGVWTTAPGIEMDDSPVAGYNIITLQLGEATQAEVCFNDGNGNWDSNNMQNYFFPTGTSRYENGQVLTGAPVADTTAPTVPSGLNYSARTASTISLTWNASTDNIGVAGYEIYRGGVQVGTSAGTSYTDTGLAQNTSYSYTVKAYDGALNKSAASSTLNATTLSGNTATIYYRTTYATPYIHYCPTGGSWTTAPGAAMDASEVYGYSKITIQLGSATTFTACFNDGSGNWDNNGGQNYSFSGGTSALKNGVITTGIPVNNTVVLYYKRGYTTPYIHYCPNGGSWTTAPGIAIQNSPIPGYSLVTVELGTAAGMTACFNNGQGQWDNNGGQNYSISMGTKTFDNGQIISGAP